MGTPEPENATYACVGALLDELVRCGVVSVCLCPGSRSAPLAISAARHPSLRVWTLIDERCAGFFALGMARSSRRPVAVVTTSGTAAANLLPAVVEARYGRVPLIVLTADRPRELRDVAAPQTIDQVRLYGGHVKWFADVAPPAATDAGLRYYRTTACRAAAVAQRAPAGPIHLNVPLDEPLVPAASGDMPALGSRDVVAWEGRPDGACYVATSASLAGETDPASARRYGEALSRATRGVIVVGPQDDPNLPASAARLAAAAGYPILADPLSQVRAGRHDRRSVIDAYDALLRIDEAADALAPDVIVRLGGVPASKPLFRYLERHRRARQIVVDGDGWVDPTYGASDVVPADPSQWCDAVAAHVELPAGATRRQWAARWAHLGAIARTAIRRWLEDLEEPFEGKIFAELSELLPDGSTLYVGNSMPVRDLDTFFEGTARSVRVLGNRGASGIDGLVSSALGAAAAAARLAQPAKAGRTVLVLGDLAFYHDLNGLLAAKLYQLPATIILLNNDGGGIFSFLPQASYPHFEALFGTPTGLDFGAAVEAYGGTYVRERSWAGFRRAVEASFDRPAVSVVEMRTDRDRNVSLHQETWNAVAAAVRAELRDAPAAEA